MVRWKFFYEVYKIKISLFVDFVYYKIQRHPSYVKRGRGEYWEEERRKGKGYIGYGFRKSSQMGKTYQGRGS